MMPINQAVGFFTESKRLRLYEVMTRFLVGWDVRNPVDSRSLKVMAYVKWKEGLDPKTIWTWASQMLEVFWHTHKDTHTNAQLGVNKQLAKNPEPMQVHGAHGIYWMDHIY